MPNQKISTIPINATALTGAELFEVTQGGVTKKVTAAQIAALSVPYLVYRALLTQMNNDAPVAVVLENTLGEVPTFGYNTPGNYSLIVVAPLFVVSKTFIKNTAITSFSDVTNIAFLKAERFADNQIALSVLQMVDNGGGNLGVPTLVDNAMPNPVEIEILVFP